MADSDIFDEYPPSRCLTRCLQRPAINLINDPLLRERHRIAGVSTHNPESLSNSFSLKKWFRKVLRNVCEKIGDGRRRTGHAVGCH